MRRLLKIFYSILLVSNFAYSTPQMADLIIIDSDTLQLRSFPLENYLEMNSINFEKILDSQDFNMNTACYRRYQAIWKLENDSLFLSCIRDCNDERKLNFSILFSNVYSDLIFANWVTDTLLIAYGKVIHYEHVGFGSFYDKEKDIILINGIVKDIIEYDNSKSFISKYENNGALLQKYINDNINWDSIPKLDKKKRVFVKCLPSENGVEATIFKSDDDRLNSEALRVIKNIDEWSKIYSQGKLIKSAIMIPVIFDEINRL